MRTILLTGLGALGPADWFYLVIVAALVLSSFAILRRPFDNLALTIFFLASANLGVLGLIGSAIVATVLILNCLVGAALTSDLRMFAERNTLLIPLTLGGMAAVGAMNGLFRGNHLSLVLGDFYQALELPLLFLVTRIIVTTEHRFRTMTYVVIGSIMAGSGLQIAEAMTGATYLPLIDIPDGKRLVRLINYNTAIAFCALLGALPFARTKGWLIAALLFVEVNIILSWTRGLWAAAAAAGIFLLLIAPRARWTILAYGAAAVIFAPLFLYASGLGGLAEYRIAFTAKQVLEPELERPAVSRETARSPEEKLSTETASPPEEKLRTESASAPDAKRSSESTSPPDAKRSSESTSPPEENQIIKARRRLEFDLIVPEILAHPLLGKGLGATYQIPGDAVVHAPRGQIVNHHFMHNVLLEIGFRLGVPAVLIFLGVLWMYFRDALANLRASALEPVNAGLIAGLIAAVFGELVFSLTEPVLLHHPTAGLAGSIMALTMTKLPNCVQPVEQLGTSVPTLAKSSR